jgi:uncharacterized protein (DUF885 family)
LNPILATERGIVGHDRELTDYSPEGNEERARNDRETLATVRAATPAGDGERTAQRLLIERLEAGLALVDSGELFRPVRVLGSPIAAVRQVFDVMPRQSAEDWETIAVRLERVPEALDTIRVLLEEGRSRGLLASRRQTLGVARQAATWAGDGGATPFFGRLLAEYEDSGIGGGLTSRLAAAAAGGTEAYGAMARYLREEYSPDAAERDAVGPERYGLFARQSLGADVDLAEAYQWGWEELYRLEAEMAAVADGIVDGATVPEVIETLEGDPARAIHGEDALRAWLQDLMDRTIDELDGVHFDIAPPIKRVEAMIAPPGGTAAMYYTGPSEDFSRPGRTWYPTLGKTVFPRWGEVSVCYHEGVPGHHLQIAQVRYRSDRLNRFQRMVSLPGHSEGWALYAERLMDELGYFEDREYRLGYLRAQVMRAVRVVVDLGMHLELPIPATEHFRSGESWTPELGHAFVDSRSCFPKDFMASEIDRYLGSPAQAISYKLGERAWLRARDAAKVHAGAAFDLKSFHAAALDLGPLGLDQLEAELSAIQTVQAEAG